MPEFAPGPFAPPVNQLLTESFGRPLDGIEVVREAERNEELAANAHTIGNRISLGGEISEDAGDPFSMEVISHEVAHALAGGGSGDQEVSDRTTDPGEHAAHAASDAMRHFVAGGASGAAPRLAPAVGGRARIHRHEAGEHAFAVQNAAQLAANGGEGDPMVHELIAGKKIKLANGLEVESGDVTAMMGDFYGVFDKGKDGKEHLNPAKSFEALNTAPPEEMTKIIATVEAEKARVAAALADPSKPFVPTSNGELEALTAGRKADGYRGQQKKTFLELAELNNSHFNSGDPKGADDNMGAYGQLHAMALEAARAGDEDRARAMEASAQHFLTDRFASGHQFDKDKVVAIGGEDAAQRELVTSMVAPGLGPVAGGETASHAIGLGHARIQHNRLNRDGVDVGNAAGEQWHTLGDSHWADPANADGRVHEARATVASYQELGAALHGAQRGESVQAETGAVAQQVPKWDPALQRDVEANARHTGSGGVVKTEAGELGELASGEAADAKVSVDNSLRKTPGPAGLELLMRLFGHFTD